MKCTKRTIGSSEILAAVAARHQRDVFVSECKDGESWGANGHRRIDAWAMARSWSPFRTYGYEIKVSRADFAQDQKWVEYLPCCHHFAFACPAGLIRSSDLPEGVGLLWLSPSGTLITKLKSRRREPDPKRLLALMSYVLMSRARVVADMYEANGTREPAASSKLERLQQVAQWVAEADQRHELACVVAEHVRERFAELKIGCEEAQRQLGEANDIRQHLRDRGINWDAHNWRGTWQVRDEIDQLIGYLETRGLAQSMHRLEQQLAGARQLLDEMAVQQQRRKSST
jgi:hypothetical protein